jgi:hypothetical protein
MKLHLLLVSVSLIALVGCGVGPNPSCTPKPFLSVSPTLVIVDHTATPPGNQVKFTTTETVTYSSPSGQICAVPALIEIVNPVWTNPQPQQISISSANDSTNGTAVCLAPTNGPVTLTGTVAATPNPLTITAQLQCN